MTSKRLRLIMELIFIFILPIAFILPSISIENEYVYDNNGNFESSVKKVSWEYPFSDYQDNLMYDNILYFNQLVNVNDGFTIVASETQTNQQKWYNLPLEIPVGHIVLIKLGGNENVKWQVWNLIDNNNPNGWGLSSDYVGVHLNNTSTSYGDFIATLQYPYIKFRNLPYNYSIDTDITVYLQLFDLTAMYGSGYEPSIEDFNSQFTASYYNYVLEDIIHVYSNDIISSDYQYHYSVWGSIFNIFLYEFNLNDNLVLRLVLFYTILWVLMFFMWHIFYCFLDWIVHIWSPREESERLRHRKRE